MEQMPKHSAEGDRQNKIRKAVQVALAERYFGFKPASTQMLRWIEEHGKTFGDIVAAEPEVLARYDQNPEGALWELEEKLHERETRRA